MRGLLRILCLIWGFMSALISVSFALEAKCRENILISKNETVSKDIAMAAKSIRIKGTIDGDLMAIAQSININGSINQDLIALAERIDVDGQIKDDLRGIVQYLTIDGKVGSNLTAFCESLVIGEGAQIGAEVTVGCNGAEIYGEVRDRLRIWAGEVIEVNGTILGDAHLTAERVILLPSALIKGDLNYKSKNEIEIREGAKILGLVNWERVEIAEPVERPETAVNVASILFKILYLVAALIVGIIIISLSRKHARLVSDTMVSSIWKCLGSGFVFLVCVPFAVIILAITLVGIPISIFAIFIYIMAIYVGKIFVGLTIGKGILAAFKKEGEVSLILSMIIGMIILTLVVNIPYIGWIIWLASTLVGIGALLISRIKLFTELKQKEII